MHGWLDYHTADRQLAKTARWVSIDNANVTSMRRFRAYWQIKNLVDESLGFSSTRLALIHLIRRLQRTPKHGLNAKHARTS